MMRKISGENQSTSINHQEINSTKIIDKTETLAESNSKIEGNNDFQTIKQKAEKHP